MSPECGKPLESWKGKETNFPLELSEGTGTIKPFQAWLSELEESTFVVRRIHIWGNYYRIPRNEWTLYREEPMVPVDPIFLVKKTSWCIY